MSQQIATKKTSGATQPHFDELQAFRGIAALCIIIFHNYQYAQHTTGSPIFQGSPMHNLFSGLHLSGMFFVLSGFLLFLPFARSALSQQAPRSARSFLILRLIRILPLYYLTLLVVWSWRFVGDTEQVIDLLLHLTFTHTFHETYIFWTIGPAWSLAVEMHFYLFLAGFGPLVYYLCGKLASSQQRQLLLAGLLSILIGASIVYKWWAFTSPTLTSHDWPIYYSLPAKFDAIGLGMLLALIVASRHGQPIFGAITAFLLQLVGIGVIASAIWLDSTHPLVHLYYTTLVGSGTTLLISSTTLGPRGSWWEWCLRLPPLQFLGTISYGLFLLHEPIMIELGRAGILISPTATAFPANTAIVVLLSIGAATLSYYLLEQPWNELRHLFDRNGRRIERYRKIGATTTTQAYPAQ